jgi:hypothetical protein
MRDALAIVQENPPQIDSFAIAALIYDVRPEPDGVTYLVTPAQRSAVRRALVALVRAGKVVDMGRSFSPTPRRQYATPECAATKDRELRRIFGRGLQPSDPIKPRHASPGHLEATAGSPPERI